jgi:hypothetical protein
MNLARPGRLTALISCLLLLAAGCDSGQPSGDALRSPVPATFAPSDARAVATGDAVPTLTAVSALAANSTPASVNDDIPTPDLDACTLLTEAEAEAATGLQLQRADYVDKTTPGAKCRYETEGESVSLKVFAPLDEAHAARVWQGKYSLYSYAQLATYSQYMPGVGDAAFVYVPRSSAGEFMSQRFWYLVAKSGSTYFELLWLTGSEDPTAALAQMASKIVSRL